MWAALIALLTGLGAAFTGDMTWQEFAIAGFGIVFGYLRTISNSSLTK
jgi:hypothetical protein